MSFWAKLGLPLALGLAAAFINFVSVTSEKQPFECIRLVGRDLEAGDVITEEIMERAEMFGDFSELETMFVAWEDRAMVLGRPLRQPLRTGAPVLLRDTTPVGELPIKQDEVSMTISTGQIPTISEFIRVGEMVSFAIANNSGENDTIGKFRVLAVGNRTTQLDQGKVRNERTLTVAAKFKVDNKLDPNSQRLLNAQNGLNGFKLMAVLQHPSSEIVTHRPTTHPVSIQPMPVRRTR